MQRISDGWLRKEAVELRTRLATALASQFIDSFNPHTGEALISRSLLKSVLERQPFENCLEKLSFSLWLTEVAVNEVLTSRMAPLQKVGVVGYLVELSAREFIDPFDTKSKYNHLSSSKELGYFFTPPSLACEMARLASTRLPDIRSVFDPSCGSGTLLAITLLSNPQIECLTGVEIDEFTCKIAKHLLETVRSDLGIKTNIEVHNRDYLDYVVSEVAEVEHGAFDLVIMNPPYGRVRFLTSNLTDKGTRIGLDVEKSAMLHKQLRNKHILSAAQLRNQFAFIGLGHGTPEYSKLFLGSSIAFVRPQGCIVAITPSSWLADQNGKGLRQYLLRENSLEEIWHFNETAKLFQGVNQPTTVVLIRTQSFSPTIKIQSDLRSVTDLNVHSEDLDSKKIEQFSPSWLRIPRYGNSTAELLSKLHSHKTLASYSEILNLRGELDLTAHKDLVAENPALTRLIRGDHIQKYRLKATSESDRSGYVNATEFLNRLGNSDKRNHINFWRIAIPQCTYMQKKKRLEACLVPPGSVISNSCNYIVLRNEVKGSISDRLLFYCAVLNSSLIEWRFRIFNSNNHVANYEIDEFPLLDFDTIDPYLKQKLIGHAKLLVGETGEVNDFIVEAILAYLYNLTVPEFRRILDDIDHPEPDTVVALMQELIGTNL
jgi:Alw26I/Eco31I/Esp3I family type II restriction m6 adenine DNA methyltransferase